MTMSQADHGPGVWCPPPFLFAGGFLVAWLLDRWLMFEIDGRGPGALQTAVGAVLLAGGLSLMGWALVTFARARTAIIPHRPARVLVQEGPYRFTRNPMYVGLTAAYLGLAFALNAAWPLVMLPIVLLALVRLVVRREERYLVRKFGDVYADYGRHVRRWL